ncbi:hypothetical protein STEG23_008271 [Scotinomys teguina]
MARKAGQGKEEEESRARQQEEKTPVRDEEKTPACDGRGHHVVEQARTSSTILNRYEKSEQPCLIPDFSGIALSFCPFNLMLAVNLLYIVFVMFNPQFDYFLLSTPPGFLSSRPVYCLKSILLDIRTATPACFLGPLDWKTFFQLFTLSF